MGKRSEFDRKDKDFYVTPEDGILPLIPFLPADINYADPCCGDGAIEEHIAKNISDSLCVFNSDIQPRGIFMDTADAQTQDYGFVIPERTTHFITNPPWSRDKKSGYLLHNIIDNLSCQLPTWLLFDSDWMHTKQAEKYLVHCAKIVSVGRLCWFPETKQTGKDNCCWYLFDRKFYGNTEFFGRKK